LKKAPGCSAALFHEKTTQNPTLREMQVKPASKMAHHVMSR